MTIHPRQVLSAFGWSFVQTWGSQFTNLVVFIVLARLLEVRDIGLVAFALVFIYAGQSFALSGVSDALIQKKNLSQETMSAVFWLNMLIATALALGLFLVAPLLQGWFKMDGLSSVLRWISPMLLLQALASVQVAQFRRKLQMRPVAIRDLLASIMGGTAGILTALSGWGVYALVVNVLFGRMLSTIFLWWCSTWRPNLEFRLSEMRELAHFALHRTGSSVLDLLNYRLGVFFIGMFLGPAALGYYAVAERALQSINLTTSAVVDRAAFPLFSRLQSNLPILRSRFLQVSRIAAVFSIGLSSFLFLFAPETIHLLFGEQWLPSVAAMRILCVAAVAANLLNLNRLLLRSTGHAGWEFVSFIIQVIFCSVGFYFAAQISIEAVAKAVVLILALMLPFVIILNRFTTGVALGRYALSIVGPVLVAGVASLFTLATARAVPSASLLDLLVLSIVFSAIYGLMSVVLLWRDLLVLKELLMPRKENEIAKSRGGEVSKKPIAAVP
jgi:O-antigen/teichoic acid export membrane protein